MNYFDLVATYISYHPEISTDLFRYVVNDLKDFWNPIFKTVNNIKEQYGVERYEIDPEYKL